ncbi:MAG: hypothetical protein FWD83_09160 [Promicromonosporaceae bacterium]|nr:hypothetical protein [Promicromonosporaceae bacterium]
MSESRFHRPASLDQSEAEEIANPGDPALREELANVTAQAVMHLDRANEYPQSAARLLHLLTTDGLDSAAALWADAAPGTLPNRLWRIYEARVAEGAAPTAEELRTLATATPVPPA